MTEDSAPRFGRFSIDAGLVLLAVAVAALFGPLAPELVSDWSRSGDFTHGFAVPVVAIWLVLLRRSELRQVAARPDRRGLWLLAGGILIHWVGVAGSEFTLQRAAVVPVLLGWTWAWWGGGRTRIVVFPILFLLFMIPPPTLVWNTISLPLQLFASRGAETLLGWIGVKMVREGNVIHLANCSLEVAHACSGLRSLTGLLAMGALLAEGTLLGDGPPRRLFGRVVTFLAAVPVAVAINGLRVAGTAVAVSRWGPQAATGTIHDSAGALTFLFGFLALLGTRKVMAWLESPRRA